MKKAVVHEGILHRHVGINAKTEDFMLRKGLTPYGGR